MKLFSRFKKKQKPTRDKEIYTGNTSFTVFYIEENPETEINNFTTKTSSLELTPVKLCFV